MSITLQTLNIYPDKAQVEVRIVLSLSHDLLRVENLTPISSPCERALRKAVQEYLLERLTERQNQGANAAFVITNGSTV